MADDKKAAQQIAQNTFTFEEFFVQEIEKKNISAKQFTTQNETIKVHVHCHQKALSTTQSVLCALSIPLNYKVTAYNSGCCGMAGSFGFEKEHYKLSMQIGEDTLFPKINNNNLLINEKNNIILHLKCSMSDINNKNYDENIQHFQFNETKIGDLNYEVINKKQNITYSNNYNTDDNIELNNDKNIKEIICRHNENLLNIDLSGLKNLFNSALAVSKESEA